MPDPMVVLGGAAVLLAVGFLLAGILRQGQGARSPDLYLDALEAWSAGDLDRAERDLRSAVAADPKGVDSFLKLGDLFRLRGQADRAAVLHRGLIARADLPANRRVQAGLSLAEDLLALSRYEEAGQVLDTLVRQAGGQDRYWWARFSQWIGLADDEEAARALKFAGEHLDPERQAAFRSAYGFFQLDRAYAAALEHDHSRALALCKKIPADSSAKAQVPLVEAVVKVGKGDTSAAMDIAASSLERQPEALSAFQSVLRPALLEQGQFARAIPLLERVVQQPEAPLPLVVELALLYEKTGRREDAVDLLVRMKGRVDLTCGSAALLLNVLIRSGCDARTRDLWDALHHQHEYAGWSCSHCATPQRRYGWFCPACLHFGAFRPGNRPLEGGS